jgi:predicted permease
MTEFFHVLRMRLRALFRRAQLDRDLEEEFAFHLDMKRNAPADGQRRPFGNRTLVKENARAMWTFQAVESWWQDLRFGARMLRRSPVFACIAVVSLAIGIGANTATFSVLDALLLKQLPVQSPEQLRVVQWSQRSDADVPFQSYDGDCEPDGTGRRVCGSFSYPTFKAMSSIPQFSKIIGFSELNVTVTLSNMTEIAFAHLVSGDYFTALGVNAVAGRVLAASDGEASQPIAAVISYQYWTRRFGKDARAIGREILINNKPAWVVGIAPADFHGLYPGNAPDVYIQMAKAAEIGAEWRSLEKADYWWVQVFARMRAGASDEAARASADAVLRNEMATYLGRSKRVACRVGLDAGGGGLATLRNDLSRRMSILAAAVGLVLLIACTNLANLLSARAGKRQREIAVRLSVGASRMRVVRQLLTEGGLLAMVGGAIGLSIAIPILHLLLTFYRDEPLEINAGLDSRSLAFALCVSIGSALLFSLMPALRATRVNRGPARLRFGALLVSAQVALSLLLLIGSGLFIRTLRNLQEIRLGFDPENVMTFRTDASLNGTKAQALAVLYAQIRERIERIPGVVSVALSRHALLDGGASSDVVRVPGQAVSRTDATHDAMLHFCSDSFLSTFKIPIVLGRDLSRADSASAQRVAVISERFSKKYFPGVDPVGREFFLGDDPKDPAWSEAIRIVGVASDAHYTSVRSEPKPTAYLPYVQHARNLQQMVFSIRTSAPPLRFAEQVRKAVAQVDRSVPVAFVRTEQDLIDTSLRPERLFAGVVSWLGMVAALLAAIGLYGVVSYSVSRRTAEIGIRLALGAKSRDVLWMVLRECLSMVAIGLLLGIPAAFALTRLLQSTLYGVKPTDGISYSAAALLMIAVSTVATLIPARRAASIQPMRALKYE